MSRLAEKAQQEESRKARLRPVILGVGAVTVLLATVLLSGVWESEAPEPQVTLTPGRIQVGGQDALPPKTETVVKADGPWADAPVRFYEILAQGNPPAEEPVEELVVRDLPLPPPAGEAPEPIVALEAPLEPATDRVKAEPVPDAVVVEVPVVEVLAEAPQASQARQAPQTVAAESKPVADREAPESAEEELPETIDVATPADSPAAAPDVPRPFTLQVGSFSQQVRAKELVARLKGAQHDAYMVEVDLGSKGIWWRVRVGHFETSQSAKWAKLDLVKLGVSPIVIRDHDAASP